MTAAPRGPLASRPGEAAMLSWEDESGAAPAHAGRLIWIGLRPAREAPVLAPAEARLDPEAGLAGEHYARWTQRKRQITLLQSEHLAVIESQLGRWVTPDLEPAFRRNVERSILQDSPQHKQTGEHHGQDYRHARQ